jgi:hypothetical protein
MTFRFDALSTLRATFARLGMGWLPSRDGVVAPLMVGLCRLAVCGSTAQSPFCLEGQHGVESLTIATEPADVLAGRI